MGVEICVRVEGEGVCMKKGSGDGRYCESGEKGGRYCVISYV